MNSVRSKRKANILAAYLLCGGKNCHKILSNGVVDRKKDKGKKEAEREQGKDGSRRKKEINER